MRIFNLLREMSGEFDIFLFAFRDAETAADLQPVLDLCARLILVDKPRYREPRWSTLAPPEVHEFRSPAMFAALARIRAEYKIEAVQVEYTMLAPYVGDVLVEHDVTFELYRQIRDRSPGIARRWDYWRWRRFEKKWIRRYRKVVVMSEQDRALLAQPNVAVIPNGVDLERFTPEIERPGQRLLFIGSFRHFPNIVAYRFFVEQVWPILRDKSTGHHAHSSRRSGSSALLARAHRPLFDLQATIASICSNLSPTSGHCMSKRTSPSFPTLVSAGTNLKVLEAMAMDRAVVSTSSGCAGLGLGTRCQRLDRGPAGGFRPGHRDFARWTTICAAGSPRAGRVHVERNFGWRQIGARQRALLRELMPPRVQIRPATESDLSRTHRDPADRPRIVPMASRRTTWRSIARCALSDGRIRRIPGFPLRGRSGT